MTDPVEVEVTQADRDAAGAYFSDLGLDGDARAACEGPRFKATAEAFARHRIASVAAARPFHMEEAAGIAEGFTRFADKPDHADAPKLIATAIRAAKTDGAAHDR